MLSWYNRSVPTSLVNLFRTPRESCHGSCFVWVIYNDNSSGKNNLNSNVTVDFNFNKLDIGWLRETGTVKRTRGMTMVGSRGPSVRNPQWLSCFHSVLFSVGTETRWLRSLPLPLFFHGSIKFRSSCSRVCPECPRDLRLYPLILTGSFPLWVVSKEPSFSTDSVPGSGSLLYSTGVLLVFPAHILHITKHFVGGSNARVSPRIQRERLQTEGSFGSVIWSQALLLLHRIFRERLLFSFPFLLLGRGNPDSFTSRLSPFVSPLRRQSTSAGRGWVRRSVLGTSTYQCLPPFYVHLLVFRFSFLKKTGVTLQTFLFGCYRRYNTQFDSFQSQIVDLRGSLYTFLTV